MSGPGWRDCALLAGLLALWSSVALSDQGGTPPPRPPWAVTVAPPASCARYSGALHCYCILQPCMQMES